MIFLWMFYTILLAILTLIFPRYVGRNELLDLIDQGTSPNAPLSEEVMLINGGDW